MEDSKGNQNFFDKQVLSFVETLKIGFRVLLYGPLKLILFLLWITAIVLIAAGDYDVTDLDYPSIIIIIITSLEFFFIIFGLCYFFFFQNIPNFHRSWVAIISVVIIYSLCLILTFFKIQQMLWVLFILKSFLMLYEILIMLNTPSIVVSDFLDRKFAFNKKKIYPGKYLIIYLIGSIVIFFVGVISIIDGWTYQEEMSINQWWFESTITLGLWGLIFCCGFAFFLHNRIRVLNDRYHHHLKTTFIWMIPLVSTYILLEIAKAYFRFIFIQNQASGINFASLILQVLLGLVIFYKIAQDVVENQKAEGGEKKDPYTLGLAFYALTIESPAVVVVFGDMVSLEQFFIGFIFVVALIQLGRHLSKKYNIQEFSYQLLVNGTIQVPDEILYNNGENIKTEGS
jgi:hypothetical protein